MRNLIVVDDVKKIDFRVENAELISAKEYLVEYSSAKKETARVYNLCKSYKYQSAGYYVSLLALARGHKILPSITTIQDLKSQAMLKFCNEKLKDYISTSLAKIKTDSFVLSIYFGRNIAKQHSRLCKKIFEMFRAPLLRASFVRINKTWKLKNINAITLNEVPDYHIPYFKEFARHYFRKKRYSNPYRDNSIYDLAILVGDYVDNAPSNKEAIDNFIDAAESLGFYVDLLSKDDFQKIPEYDALFIRETTSVNHHTYRFARQAFAEGLVVIDDPESIIKCTNKVYTAELLNKAKIATPKTLVVHKQNEQLIEDYLGFPCVLKQPDSSFSQGVVKVDDKEMLQYQLENYYKTSELIIAQEFMQTDFDWRIGILNKKVLFACKYYMARNHWQIYNWKEQNNDSFGDFDAVEIDNVPKTVINTALKAAALIGDGFYGVDIKERNRRAYVIEINDNPNVDAGIEDKALGKELYLEIMRTIFQRIQSRKGSHHV